VNIGGTESITVITCVYCVIKPHASVAVHTREIFLAACSTRHPDGRAPSGVCVSLNVMFDT